MELPHQMLLETITKLSVTHIDMYISKRKYLGTRMVAWGISIEFIVTPVPLDSVEGITLQVVRAKKGRFSAWSNDLRFYLQRYTLKGAYY